MGARQRLEAALDRLAAAVPNGELLAATDPAGLLDLVVHSLATARAGGFAAGVAAAAKWCEENTWDTEAELYEGLRALSPPGREG